MNMNVIVIVIIVIIILCCLNTNKESLTNVDDMSNKINKFMTEETTYSEYIELLKMNNNISYKLVSPETFYELKLLIKQNKLTPTIIQGYMSDYN
jgi:hypothetical protein